MRDVISNWQPGNTALWLRQGVGCLISLPILALIGFFILVIYLAFPLSMEHALPHPIPMPDVPQVLVKLPAQAQIQCQNPENSGRVADPYEDSIRVWSHPGLFPPRPDDSNYHAPVADYGPEQGQIARCSEVQVTDFAWSEFDGEFLVWVEMTDSVTASGWIQMGVLEFR